MEVMWSCSPFFCLTMQYLVHMLQSDCGALVCGGFLVAVDML